MELTFGENDNYDNIHQKNITILLESFDKKDLIISGKRSGLRSKNILIIEFYSTYLLHFLTLFSQQQFCDVQENFQNHT